MKLEFDRPNQAGRLLYWGLPGLIAAAGLQAQNEAAEQMEQPSNDQSGAQTQWYDPQDWYENSENEAGVIENDRSSFYGAVWDDVNWSGNLPRETADGETLKSGVHFSWNPETNEWEQQTGLYREGHSYAITFDQEGAGLWDNPDPEAEAEGDTLGSPRQPSNQYSQSPGQRAEPETESEQNPQQLENAGSEEDEGGLATFSAVVAEAYEEQEARDETGRDADVDSEEEMSMSARQSWDEDDTLSGSADGMEEQDAPRSMGSTQAGQAGPQRLRDAHSARPGSSQAGRVDQQELASDPHAGPTAPDTSTQSDAVQTAERDAAAPESAEHSVSRSLSGSIEGFRSIDMEYPQGVRHTHVLARLSLENGERAVVDLGDVELLGVDLQQGQQVTLNGTEGAIDEQRVFVATEIVTKSEETIPISRAFALSEPASSADSAHEELGSRNSREGEPLQGASSQRITLEGELEEMLAAEVGDEGETRAFLKLRLPSGRAATIDLGAQATLSDIGLQQGDQVSVRGKRSEIDGRMVVAARSISIEQSQR